MRSAWEKLKLTAEAQERDDLLTQFDGKIAQGLKDRVAHASGMGTAAAAATTAAAGRDAERNRTLAQA